MTQSPGDGEKLLNEMKLSMLNCSWTTGSGVDQSLNTDLGFQWLWGNTEQTSLLFMAFKWRAGAEGKRQGHTVTLSLWEDLMNALHMQTKKKKNNADV